MTLVICDKLRTCTESMFCGGSSPHPRCSECDVCPKDKSAKCVPVAEMVHVFEVTEYGGVMYYLVPTMFSDCHGCDFDSIHGCTIGIETDCIRAKRVILRAKEEYDKENEICHSTTKEPIGEGKK